MSQLTAANIREPRSVEDSGPRVRLGFITAIPQSVQQGSGCYVGIGTLAAGATALGHNVDMIMPSIRLGSFLAERYLFNL